MSSDAPSPAQDTSTPSLIERVARAAYAAHYRGFSIPREGVRELTVDEAFVSPTIRAIWLHVAQAAVAAAGLVADPPALVIPEMGSWRIVRLHQGRYEAQEFGFPFLIATTCPGWIGRKAFRTAQAAEFWIEHQRRRAFVDVIANYGPAVSSKSQDGSSPNPPTERGTG